MKKLKKKKKKVSKKRSLKSGEPLDEVLVPRTSTTRKSLSKSDFDSLRSQFDERVKLVARRIKNPKIRNHTFPASDPLLKEDRPPLKRRAGSKNLQLFTTSYSITPDIDEAIQLMAIQRNVSRSSIVRQAVLNYFLSEFSDDK